MAHAPHRNAPLPGRLICGVVICGVIAFSASGCASAQEPDRTSPPGRAASGAQAVATEGGAGKGPARSTRRSATGAAFLDSYERAVLAEMNRVRKNPPAYAAVLQRQRRYYDGRLLRLPGEVPLVTQEGPRAVTEAIRALKRARPAPPLRPSPGMSKAAADHVRDLGPAGRTSHVGSDGSDPFARLERHGQWLGSAAENIHYGAPSARQVVIQLLVDDGVPGRGHRKTILDPDYRVTGVACGPHRRLRTVCVATYAGGYRERGRD